MESLRKSYALPEGMEVTLKGNIPQASFRLNGQPVPLNAFSGISAYAFFACMYIVAQRICPGAVGRCEQEYRFVGILQFKRSMQL